MHLVGERLLTRRALLEHFEIKERRDHRTAMMKQFITTTTKRLRGKAGFSIAVCFAPPSEFITDGIIVDYPRTGVCTISFCNTYAQTNRFIFIPAPIATRSISDAHVP